MKKLLNPDLIIVAREALGITQSELAKKLKIDQGNLSKMENGFLSIPEEIVKSISQILSFPLGFFYETGSPYQPHVHYFRKAKTLPSKDLISISAKAIIDRLRIEKLLESIELNANYPSFPIEEYETPEIIANTLRQHWKIPMGTISNVTDLIENHGIIVFPIDFGTRLISDITTDTEKGIYIIFLNSVMPPDRKRFTLCHVLGHIIMHNFSKIETIEQEADRFASEFLIPSNEIIHSLTNLSISKLADLKRQWKVSMQSILVKAGQLNIITEKQKTRLWQEISTKGFRLKEPVDISIKNEEPTILKDIIECYKKELNYSEMELAEFLFLRNEEYPNYQLYVRPKLRLLHFDNK
jgi:Zn-dependent peptidase ImmA (M78 family)/DNA-binding XRE family transcriptional regulator